MMFERADERAAEREERMRKVELEMEAKMREREDRREDRMFSMFAAVMQQMGGTGRPSQPPFMQPPPFSYQPSFQLPIYTPPPPSDQSPTSPLTVVQSTQNAPKQVYSPFPPSPHSSSPN